MPVLSKKEQERKNQQAERHQGILSGLLREEDNKYCVDCDAKGPRWASWNLGIFLCIRCAGIHRNLGCHISKVKSVNLDSWTDDQVETMMIIGNSLARAGYEAELPDNYRRPQTDSALEQFIRSKYEHKKWMSREWVRPVPDGTRIPKFVQPDKKTRKPSGDKREITANSIKPPPLSSQPASTAPSTGGSRRDLPPSKPDPSPNSSTTSAISAPAPPQSSKQEPSLLDLDDGPSAGDFSFDPLALSAPAAAPPPSVTPHQAATNTATSLPPPSTTSNPATITPPSAATSTSEELFSAMGGDMKGQPQQAPGKNLKDDILKLYASQPQPSPGMFNMGGNNMMMGGGPPPQQPHPQMMTQPGLINPNIPHQHHTFQQPNMVGAGHMMMPGSAALQHPGLMNQQAVAAANMMNMQQHMQQVQQQMANIKLNRGAGPTPAGATAPQPAALSTNLWQ